VALFQGANPVGLDIGTASIKLVETVLPARARVRVRRLSSLPTPSGALAEGVVMQPGRIAAALRLLWQRAAPRTRRVAVSVSGPGVLVRRLPFPKMRLPELRKILALQLDRYVPFAKDGAFYDIYPLGPGLNPGEMEVLFAAAPARQIATLTEACRQAGLQPVRVEVDALPLIRALVGCGLIRIDSSVAVLDIGAGGSRISLTEHGIPVLTRFLGPVPGTTPVPAPVAGGSDADDLGPLPDSAPTSTAVQDPLAAGLEGLESFAQLLANQDLSLDPALEDYFWDVRKGIEFTMAATKTFLPEALFLTGGGATPLLAQRLESYLREWLGERLGNDFAVRIAETPMLNLLPDFNLAFGLAIPPEHYDDE